MVRFKLGVMWTHTAHILAALEGCRSNEAEFDPERWKPAEYRNKPKTIDAKPSAESHKAEVAAFNAHVRRQT